MSRRRRLAANYSLRTSEIQGVRIVILTNYFCPETVGAGIWVTQLARDLQERGHQVRVVTSFPSYPEGRIFPGYRNCWSRCERIGEIEVIRTYTYATPSKSFWPRLLSFATFCLSSLGGYLRHCRRADVVYAVLPPLPLGVSGWLIAKASRARLVVNIQDIYPDIAVALGYLRNAYAVAFARWMEGWIYRHSHRVCLISESFRENLLAKGVSPDKLRLTPNWADMRSIRPRPRSDELRRSLAAEGDFLVLYSGGLTENASLDVLIEAASMLRHEPIRFAFIGDGVQRLRLAEHAANLGLTNVTFLPFQPLQRYPEVLAAADLTVVSLKSAAALASVPSKIYKQMAAGRPILAIAEPGTELTRLLAHSQCGVAVRPDDVERLAAVIRSLSRQPRQLEEMGRNGRAYVEKHHSREICVPIIEQVLSEC